MVCQAKESNKAHHKVFVFAETSSYGAFHARSFVLSHNFFLQFQSFHCFIYSYMGAMPAAAFGRVVGVGKKLSCVTTKLICLSYVSV